MSPMERTATMSAYSMTVWPSLEAYREGSFATGRSRCVFKSLTSLSRLGDERRDLR